MLTKKGKKRKKISSQEDGEEEVSVAKRSNAELEEKTVKKHKKKHKQSHENDY